MIISVASGKGGTGKTSFATNLALSIDNVQLLDCDVEEPNSYLFLKPEINKTENLYILVPSINESLCDNCGKCAKFCEFNAIFVSRDKTFILPELCHSCGGCKIVCPKGAIKEEPHKTGTIYYGNSNGIEIIYGELEVGDAVASNVVREVKSRMNKNKNVIIDSPPGASCPVIESVKNSDFSVLVTEPTPFGLHDLKIAISLLREMKIPFGVVVNRADIGDKKIYDYCKKEGIDILLEIPFERKIAELYSKGIPFVLEMAEWKEKFQKLFNTIKEKIQK
ncbi:MAG: ATP-binding protein [bacterium]|uniref:MinD superfamily P-loop ATPase n=2 Tax=Bacteria candidate phyla TaxID=1783234 RepID=A0A101I256_UNCT6|nr:MAG: MinD superfamily P-loop ATPase [candidate division TA06 bacterium 32_111]KUK87617.1 MAG: MinD superfamily P-loop ATPase [candidate division TA06 bacterium 34_109]MDI6699751.1 ATP-binding protein [bacterium]HAF07455.1 (4Fe-4S)-binding protein [candidate division WOR-3 bacterium]HCP17524.1 (4Fe-4S)-binding protein [candidate division WOR-3 bacterium]